MQFELQRVYRGCNLIAGLGVLFVAAGCYNAPESSARFLRATTPIAGETGNDVYVYYPAYGVYHNTTRHQYVYWEGRYWVNRSELPVTWAKNLAATPEVPVDFHDAPERHHATIVQAYPRNWHSESSRVTLNSAVQ